MADPIDRPRRSYAGPEGSERAMFQAALSQSSLHRFWRIQRRIARDGSPGTRNASDPLRLVDRRSPYPATRHRNRKRDPGNFMSLHTVLKMMHIAALYPGRDGVAAMGLGIFPWLEVGEGCGSG